MDTRINFRSFVASTLLAYAFGGLLLANTPSYALPVYAHGESFINDSGATANDLHVDLPHPVRQPNGNALKDFGSPTFATVSVAQPLKMSLDWKGADATRPGTVAPNASATIFWYSSFASDVVIDGFWTSNGTNIGQLATKVAAFNTTENPDGTMTVALNNSSGSAVSYSDLEMFTGADSAFFTAPDFLDHLSSGTAVSLLVPTSGLFPAGVTDLATFTPSASGYSGWAMTLDGELLAEGFGTIAEPSCILLLGAAIGVLLGQPWRRRKPR